MTFGEKLRTLRLQNNWSMTDLIKRINDEDGTKISRGRLSMWENDANDPNFRVVQKLAKLFDISVDYFDDNAGPINEYRKNNNSELNNIYNQLLPRRKTEVLEFAKNQLNEQEK